MATIETLANDTDVTPFVTTDLVKGEWFHIIAENSSLVADLNMVAYDIAAYNLDPSGYTPETTTLFLAGATPPAVIEVFCPANWRFQFQLDNRASGSVKLTARTMIVPKSPTLHVRGADFGGDDAAALAALTAAVEGVITDLEGDTAGDSVAGAIADLETAIGA